MNNLTLAPVQDFWAYGIYRKKDWKYETRSTFTRFNRKTKYVKILSLCLTPASADLIYPNTKQPLMHQVRDMCRHGLLDRYTDGKRYYYKTTIKGQALLSEALKK